MDVLLSGNTSQCRNLAYLRVINNWRKDHEDYKEKINKQEGGSTEKQREENQDNEIILLPAQSTSCQIL